MTSLYKTICETLESRWLFASVHVSHHVLEVIGAAAPSTITVGLSPDQQSVVASVSFQSVHGPALVTGTFAVAGLREVFIRGGPHADLITIDQTDGSFAIPASIVAGGGNDTVFAGNEPDNSLGGQGNDYINAGGGINRVLGQGGADTLIGGDGVNILLGGPGNDSLVGGAGNDTLFGQAGNDTLIGNGGNDMLRGGPGRDSMLGGEGDDTLWNTGGTDTLIGGAGKNTFVVYGLHGQPDNDYVAAQDKIRRIPPPTSDSFWTKFLKSYFAPFG